jgi:hypothetical protein
LLVFEELFCKLHVDQDILDAFMPKDLHDVQDVLSGCDEETTNEKGKDFSK